jgi:hypothetical protein
VSLFLLLMVTVGNLALGFGLAVHLGFGPDLARLSAGWDELRTMLRRQARSGSTHPPAAH